MSRDQDEVNCIIGFFSHIFKESHVHWTKERCGITDSGYTGIKKLQSNTKHGVEPMSSEECNTKTRRYEDTKTQRLRMTFA